MEDTLRPGVGAPDDVPSHVTRSRGGAARAAPQRTSGAEAPAPRAPPSGVLGRDMSGGLPASATRAMRHRARPQACPVTCASCHSSARAGRCEPRRARPADARHWRDQRCRERPVRSEDSAPERTYSGVPGRLRGSGPRKSVSGGSHALGPVRAGHAIAAGAQLALERRRGRAGPVAGPPLLLCDVHARGPRRPAALQLAQAAPRGADLARSRQRASRRRGGCRLPCTDAGALLLTDRRAGSGGSRGPGRVRRRAAAAPARGSQARRALCQALRQRGGPPRGGAARSRAPAARCRTCFLRLRRALPDRHGRAARRGVRERRCLARWARLAGQAGCGRARCC